MITISDSDAKTMLHIFEKRIEQSENINSKSAWESALSVIVYAISGNSECLNQFDYLE